MQPIQWQKKIKPNPIWYLLVISFIFNVRREKILVLVLTKKGRKIKGGMKSLPCVYKSDLMTEQRNEIEI